MTLSKVEVEQVIFLTSMHLKHLPETPVYLLFYYHGKEITLVFTELILLSKKLLYPMPMKQLKTE